MKPGRELDALLAEKVMGIDLKSPCTGKAEPIYQDYICDSCGAIGFESNHFPEAKFYSSNIYSAFEIVDKLLKQDNIFELRKCGTYWFAEFAPNYADSEFSPAHAICLAALKSVGYELPI